MLQWGPLVAWQVALLEKQRQLSNLQGQEAEHGEDPHWNESSVISRPDPFYEQLIHLFQPPPHTLFLSFQFPSQTVPRLSHYPQ